MKRFHRFLLSVLSGILLSVAWLGFPVWTLFFAFVPLLYLEDYFNNQREYHQSISFFGHAFLAVFIWNVITTIWIANVTLIGAFVAISINTLLMSIVLWLFHWARRILKTKLGYVTLIVFWISFEYFHYQWDFEWPWLHLGSVLGKNVKMVQWYEYTGIFGGTFWILTMNILLLKITLSILRKSPVKSSIYFALVCLLLLIVPVIISCSIYYSYTEKENPKRVVIVQPNVDPFIEDYSLDAERDKLSDFIRLARSKADDNTDFIVGPETVFENQWYWDEDKLSSNQFYLQLVDFTQQFSNAEMVFGISSYKKYPGKDVAPATARVKDDFIYDRFNTAIFIDRNGNEQIYHKSKLVAGVEKMPFYKYLSFINDMVFDLGGSAGTLGRQIEPSNFTSRDGTKIAPVICYESAFGEYITDYIKKGAELIFIITNDGWSKNSNAYKQHLYLASLRAIDTRRSIARSANTGISCFINQRGDVLQPTDWWIETSIKGTINANNEITFYVRYGDYLGRIFSFLSILFILTLIVRSKVNN